MSQKRTQLFLFALLVCLLAPVGFAAGYKVIVHPSNGATSMTRAEVSLLFMKKTTKWPDGTPVAPVDLPESSSVRSTFSSEVHGKQVNAVKSYWQQQIFSGRDIPPLEKATDAQVIAFVRNNPGSIGYVSDSSSLGDVKVITVK